ncbi:MAG: DSBA oxidoreductase [Candidatus Binatia bacterium]|nr:MAG: DSBA oxidoreductase [Candidatus Binatia bacterium]
MSLEFDLFWSFRSPYSYLVTPRIVKLVEDYDVSVRVRPVLPLAVRQPGFFRTVHPLWPRYVLLDTARIADFYGIPYGWPRPDPIVQDYTTGEIAKEQPYIFRLTRLGVEAERRGRGLPFLFHVSRLVFGGEVDGWDRGNHLADATSRAGLDLEDMEREISKDPGAHDRIIEENQKDLEAAGHWGVPTMVFRGEPFFGQDRLDLLVWRMRQHGLRRRDDGPEPG